MTLQYKQLHLFGKMTFYLPKHSVSTWSTETKDLLFFPFPPLLTCNPVLNLMMLPKKTNKKPTTFSLCVLCVCVCGNNAHVHTGMSASTCACMHACMEIKDQPQVSLLRDW